MLDRFRKHVGTAGLMVALVALVAALGGGAYAAAGGSGGGKASASAKGKAGPRGPRGKTGPVGPAGPMGPAGAKGDAGPAGANGKDGVAGANGNNGSSVSSTLENPGANCANGGTKFVAGATTTYACNGSNGSPGSPGAPGSPWTAGGTLPAGATEKGSWTVFGTEAASQGVLTSISFGIPLAAALDESHTIYVGAASNPDPTNCPGTKEEPKAASGYLCVYENGRVGFTSAPFVLRLDAATPGASPAGAFLAFEPLPGGTETGIAFGSWAVTG